MVFLGRLAAVTGAQGVRLLVRASFAMGMGIQMANEPNTILSRTKAILKHGTARTEPKA